MKHVIQGHCGHQRARISQQVPAQVEQQSLQKLMAGNLRARGPETYRKLHGNLEPQLQARLGRQGLESLLTGAM